MNDGCSEPYVELDAERFSNARQQRNHVSCLGMHGWMSGVY
jgi:hypothetical protein